MSTIRDVANYANVSLSTVSKYFHHPDKLSEEYRNRVEAAVKIELYAKPRSTIHAYQ